MHPLWVLFVADTAATVIVFVSNLICKNASVYDPYWTVQPVLLITAMYWQYGVRPALFFRRWAGYLFFWERRLNILPIRKCTPTGVIQTAASALTRGCGGIPGIPIILGRYWSG
jgi:hypothetical protein